MRTKGMMVVLLCLSLDSCNNAPTLEEGGEKTEVAISEDDSIEVGTDSLSDSTGGSNIKTENMKKKDVLLRKTKAQFVIY